MVNTFADWQIRLSDLIEQIIFLRPHNHKKIILGTLRKANGLSITHNNTLYYNHKVTHTFNKTKLPKLEMYS